MGVIRSSGWTRKGSRRGHYLNVLRLFDSLVQIRPSNCPYMIFNFMSYHHIPFVDPTGLFQQCHSLFPFFDSASVGLMINVKSVEEFIFHGITPQDKTVDSEFTIIFHSREAGIV
jgi:hypothetical protein